MKKIPLILLFFILFPLSTFAKINVVATLPVFGSLAEEIGGERVSVISLARANQDPHFLDAKPTYAVALNRADLLLHGGLELEIGWLPPVLTQSRNPKIQFNAAGNLNLSIGLRILELPTAPIDRSMGDVHPLGNPHYWLDPQNGERMAKSIAQKLTELDPAGKNYYEGRWSNFHRQLRQKMEEWNKKTSSFKGKKVITYHKSLNYFTNWTGLEVAATVEPKPGIPPSSKHVEELLEKISNQKVQGILIESFYPKKIPEYLSQKAQIPLILLTTNTDAKEAKTYFELIDKLIQEVKPIAP